MFICLLLLWLGLIEVLVCVVIMSVSEMLGKYDYICDCEFVYEMLMVCVDKVVVEVERLE